VNIPPWVVGQFECNSLPLRLDAGFADAGYRAILGGMATKRLKRPRDPIQLGKLIVDIATGQVADEEKPDTGKSAAAVARGKKGGSARARALSPEERVDIASVAAQARWKKSRS
jgi:hypothetical protein